MSTNGSTNGASAYEADLDQLYSWMPPQAPAPAPLPEAALSLTLKGSVGGIEAMLTIRGQSPEEFKRNLAAVRGLLDAVPVKVQEPQQAVSQGEGFCQKHHCAMQENVKEGRRWFSHRTAEGWCKGR
jgi:hypothetical protein